MTVLKKENTTYDKNDWTQKPNVMKPGNRGFNKLGQFHGK